MFGAALSAGNSPRFAANQGVTGLHGADRPANLIS
jgi:hypothetical protein